MRTTCTLAVVAALLIPAIGLAAEQKGGKKIETPPPSLGDFKLDDTKPAPAASDTKATPAPAASGDKATAADANKGGQPGAKPKRDLDVSKMLFDSDGVRAVISFHMPEVQECYEKVLSDSGKKIEGKVVVGLIIDTNGNVTDARVLGKKSTLKDDRVQECVLQVKSWYFPKPGDNRDHPIEYPFNLKVQP